MKSTTPSTKTPDDIAPVEIETPANDPHRGVGGRFSKDPVTGVLTPIED